LIASEYVLTTAATFWYKWPLHYKLNHTFCLHSLQPSSSSIYNNMVTYTVIDCQLLTFCIKTHAWEMYLDTYIFPFFITTGGSLVWSVEHFLTKETLHKGLTNYLKELKVLSNTEPALGNIIYCLKYSLGTLWFMPIGYSASPRRNPISQQCKYPQCQVVRMINFFPLAPDICGFSEWNLLHVTPVVPRILNGSNLFYCCCKLNAIIWLTRTIQGWLISALERRGSATLHIYNFL